MAHVPTLTELHLLAQVQSRILARLFLSEHMGLTQVLSDFKTGRLARPVTPTSQRRRKP